ncbi:extracellular solute-binding protein [Streptomyces rapamycinicus]|uniref:ABC transporter substrate-binding protein n=1 Tax=Streptomyces rapamycinicus (strain ATCC 29253 / DSM 41530 / NRRL 5491 / AYB-994) TaxID=1343740 RepID=A0A3L8RK82_STRRN|nr:extracellular solute-binding protein [Streptomyces rapamycinicus]RLV79413.1 ABC transporter substrate-binding protein [Streptomyces rapamycinicus NRRL 5491]UTO65333.1 extracellular solute-binding protein [Streptomyces rapamycinicus]UTP33289.1 extracellular solute-binding protein [Streptomyces rapamycinicus NRRL 5491]
MKSSHLSVSSRLSSRVTVPVVALALAGLAMTGCAPSTSDNSSKEDEKSGKLRVWLFQEVNNAPKKKVIDAAVAGFEKEHDGTDVEVTYIPIDTRAQKIKAAFNDPKSAPDVIEFGNTDTAGYVKDGGLLDISKEFGAWTDSTNIDPTAKYSLTIGGKVYGAPLFVGVRALYYRTDVFKELDLEPPATQDELIATAKKIHSERPDLYGLAVGGAYTYGAMPFIWANGGDLADEKGKFGSNEYEAAIDSADAQKGVKAYTSFFGNDNCPAAKCAQWGGNDTVEAFASGKAAMAIGGDFNRQAIEAGKVKGKFKVVPLPGVKKGDIAPAFAGGNNLGVLKSTSHRTIAVDLLKTLAGKQTQRELYDAMGFLPTFTDVRGDVSHKDAFVKPFVKTLNDSAKFVPTSPGWAAIDAQLVLPTMFQEIVSGRKSVPAATQDAAKKMDEAFEQ